MQQQLNQLTQSEAQLLAAQRSSVAEVNRGLFDQIQAVKAVTSAKDALAKAYETEIGGGQVGAGKVEIVGNDLERAQFQHGAGRPVDADA